MSNNMNIGAIGVDFGSIASCIAVAKRGGVEVLANEGSHRETQNIVGFGQSQRFIGEQGYVQFKSNFKNSINFFNRLLDVKTTTPYLEQERKWITANLVEHNSKVAYEVNYQGEKRRFLPEQITAMMLQKLKDIIAKNGLNNKEMVLSVPGYFTEKERQALLDAAKIAEVTVLRLFNEESAAALGYGIFRRAELDPTNQRNVIFVDFGHSKLSTYVAGFTKEKLKVLSTVHERNLGARDFDWCVFEHIAKKFNEQTGLNILKNDKAKLRLLEVIEKQRKILSANSETNISVEYLMEDEDLNFHITRVEFEKLIASELERFRGVLLKLSDEIAAKKIQIHSVELVGGASRIPIVQKLIEEIFKKECSRTLNMSECIARGCAMQAAMISPLFKVANYEVEEANYYPIKCSWIFFNPNQKGKDAMEIEDASKNQPEKQRATLFDKGCSIPNIKSLTFNREDAIRFTLFYDPVPPGTDDILGDYCIYPAKPKEKEFSIKLRVHLNHNGNVLLEEALFQEDFTEEYTVPKEVPKVDPSAKKEPQQPPADPNVQNPENQIPPQQPEPPKEPEMEVKTRKKTRQTNLKYESVVSKGFNEKELAQYFEIEAHMNNHDRLIHETHEKKNELESYIYEMRQKLGDKYKDYTTPEIAQTLLKNLTDDEQWLYADGASAPKSSYVAKIEELRKIGDPIKKRFDEYHNLPEAIKELLVAVQQFEAFVVNKDPNYEHIGEEDRNKISNECNRIKIWLDNSKKLQDSLKLHQDPVTTVSEVKKNLNELFNKCQPIMNKPKPQPKKEEPKKEEPKKEEPKPNDKVEEEIPLEKSNGEKMDLE